QLLALFEKRSEPARSRAPPAPKLPVRAAVLRGNLTAFQTATVCARRACRRPGKNRNLALELAPSDGQRLIDLVAQRNQLICGELIDLRLEHVIPPSGPKVALIEVFERQSNHAAALSKHNIAVRRLVSSTE